MTAKRIVPVFHNAVVSACRVYYFKIGGQSVSSQIVLLLSTVQPSQFQGEFVKPVSCTSSIESSA